MSHHASRAGLREVVGQKQNAVGDRTFRFPSVSNGLARGAAGPAMMGTFPAQVCTAVATISLYSRGSSEKNSPVPPAANRALAPYGASHSSRSAYAGALKLPPASKSVTGKERRPSPIMVLSSWGVNWDNALLDIRFRTTYCDSDGEYGCATSMVQL